MAEHPIGIDVERCDPIDAASVRLLLGTPAETAPNGRTPEEELRFFYARWTMFESWLKAEGTGLHENHPLSAFAPEPDGACFRVDSLKKDSPPWVIETTEIELPEPTGYRFALCRRPQESPASEIELLNGDELVRRFLMLL
ncbi:4'-phosphopantetheinyl transferase superfamily protein [Saccharibacillus sp. O23]|uniref:4'-phosphopantetheinyl transferase superfamily protein n=1 Tax=Saccharibacillus sp. O23 TaxID=2009338 RepID=UPI0015C61309|nr:4'-phosphopantetheinyl transferase superfamily protein [Saccharibacillus sp. O23]